MSNPLLRESLAECEHLVQVVQGEFKKGNYRCLLEIIRVRSALKKFANSLADCASNEALQIGIDIADCAKVGPDLTALEKDAAGVLNKARAILSQ